ncbi:MAG: hypothetical protein KKA62_03435 [Nanoarchaeota archaeon]|nr:hypothetical protein [Nanoarchaeota archaeon]MBU1644586.1 hypothetical protein [Nanoarchaeota archaeon]MBU1976978.1 hypothetical protein [Nanoarchaeota archaeon]
MNKLEYLINEIYEGQNRIDTFTKLSKSYFSKMVYNLGQKLFNDPIRSDNANVFRHQQGNLYQLGKILSLIANRSETDLNKVKSTLNQAVTSSEEYLNRYRSLARAVEPELNSYLEAKEILSVTERQENSTEYHDQLRKVIDLRRNFRLKKHLWQQSRVSANQEQILQFYELQEDLFETLLFQSKEMALTASFYEDILNAVFLTYKRFSSFSQATDILDRGAEGMKLYSFQLTDGYNQLMRDVSGILSGKSLVEDSRINDLYGDVLGL